MLNPTCFVIGDGIVPAACLDVLKRTGFLVRAIYSAEGSLEAAAEQHGWTHLPSLDSLKERLRCESYDFLFSINNGWIVPSDAIAKAKRAAINYHDSPLPRYAGLHATSWALLHGEREHAVSWHEITTTIDGGRIYKQRRVTVEEDDTALSLNTKCYEAAVGAFEELAIELASGGGRPTVQPSAGRSYFGIRDRPRAACTLPLRGAAETVRDLVRALDFGPAKNPLGLAKIWLGSEFVSVSSTIMHPGPPTADPGRVVEISEGGLRVATATRDVTLGALRTLAGHALGVHELASLGLVNGALLPELDGENADAITRFHSQVCRYEAPWVRRLSSLTPLSHPYAAGAKPRARRRRMALTQAWAELSALSDAERVVHALADFAMYLARVGPERAFDVGLSTEAQKGPDISLFSRVVPMRVSFDERTSVAELRATIEAEVALCRKMGTYSHDIFPRYPELRGCKTSRLPMVLALAEQPEDLDLDALDFDIAFAAYADGSTPELIVARELPSWQMEAIADQLGRVARVARGRPETLVVDLPLLSDDERVRIVDEWNRTAAVYPDRSDIATLVSQQAARTPDNGAVRYGGVSMSYAELERRSNQLANKLVSLGVARGDLVVLSVARSVDMVVGLLGILKAGAAYMPVDPSYPVARVRNMISDSEARAVVTCEKLRAAFFGELRQNVCFDRDSADLATQATTPPNVEVDPLDLAYVIYTSGSTGKPKGVEIPHRGLVNHSFAIAKNYGLGPGDRVLCSASISFDVAAEQIYPALFSGAEVVVRPEDLFDSFAHFETFVREEAITAMVLPTAFWHEWVRDLGTSDRGVPPSLRALSVGTEKALGEHLVEWARLTEGRVKFFQGYGPTEASVTCTMYAHDGSPLDDDRPLPIGRPLPNTEIYVLDGRREPVPIGFVGELFVGGHGLARGYHRRPELTAERFVSHPFRRGERLYRTGDLGRYEPDGQIVYVGRADLQVKLRGFRVELGEIEDALREFPGVGEVVVILHEERGQKRLVAYVVATRDVEFAKLKAYAVDRLPEYMVPSSVVRLDALPMTANQKVDRRALPPPPRSEDEPSIEPPRTELERLLAEEWSRLLGVREVGVRDDFYALGGDSLLGVRMLSRLEAKVGRVVPLSAFCRGPTIEKLAAFISSTSSRRPEPLVVVLQEGDGRAPLWLLHPVGGHLVFGRWLRKHMDSRQPILGIQARGLDGEHPPLSTVEAMAELYVGLVRERQPRGPYFLAGPSMGGFLAMEIAQRLKQQGEEVALLALLDTWGPNYPRKTSRLVYFFDQLETLRTLPTWDERIRRLKERFGASAEDGAARRRVVPPRYEVLEGIEQNGALIEAIDRVTRANEEANVAYRPRAYDGAILLLRAEKTTRWSGVRFDDPDNGWRSLALGGLRTISVSCTHLEMVDEPPPEVGEALQREIDRVRSASTSMRRHDMNGSWDPASRVARLLMGSSNQLGVV